MQTLIPRIWRRVVWPVLPAMVALAFAQPAQAGCTTASGIIDLGVASSIHVEGNSLSASGTTGFKCTGSGVLGLLMTNTVSATILGTSDSNGNQPLLRNAASGDLIPYDICQDVACASSYPVGTKITWSATSLLGLLGLLNASDGSMPLYVQSVAGQNVAAGVYTATINLRWEWDICGVGLANICLVPEKGSADSIVQVTLTVTKDCLIDAPDVNFGRAAFAESFEPVVQSLAIRCTKNAAYTVGIGDGAQPSGSRRMAMGGAYLAYELYFPASSNNRWGSTGAERASSAEATTNAGGHDGLLAQTFTYRAEILSGQTTPPPGTYSDTLIVDVAF